MKNGSPEIIRHAWQDATGQDATRDTTTAANGAQTTAYDSVWAETSMPVQQSAGIERQLLKEDKLYAVLAVVLIIWLGIAFFIIRTDRRIDRLEREVDKQGKT